MASGGIPWWARAIMSIDHNVRMLSQAVSIVRDETMLAFVPPERRQSVTTAIYDRQSTYIPGGELFAVGLYEWERRLIATPPFPAPPARILLGGAGGGREIVPLRDLGYEVMAFEPSPELVAGYQRTHGTDQRATLVVGDYGDLVRAASGASTRMPDVATRHFDAVILGWGSLSYVSPQSARADLLRAVRMLAPSAPVILSFIPGGVSAESGGSAALRRALRRILPRLGGHGANAGGEMFIPWGGFASALSTADIDQLAAQAGYRLTVLETEPYGHALLAPL